MIADEMISYFAYSQDEMPIKHKLPPAMRLADVNQDLETPRVRGHKCVVQIFELNFRQFKETIFNIA